MSAPIRLLAGIGALLGLCLAAWSEPARGQGNLKVGPVHLHPFVDQSGEFNDNLGLTPRDKVSDFVWITSPGISLELPARRYSLRLAYRADILNYMKETDLNTTYHTVDGEVRAHLFARRLTLYVADEFKRTSDFSGFPFPELLERVSRDENLLRAGAEYTLRERVALAFDYTLFSMNYRATPDFDELDRQDHILGVTLSYRILPKTWLLSEYDYQMVRYDLGAVARDRDSDAQRLKIGLRGDLTAKTTLQLKVGGEFKDFESPAREDWHGLIFEAEAVYKYREPSKLRLFGGRATVESVFENNNFYVATYGGLELRHLLRPKLLLRITGRVGVNEYPERTVLEDKTLDRLDRFYEIGAALRYQIRPWLAAELGYDFLRSDSNLSDSNYSNHRAKGTILLKF